MSSRKQVHEDAAGGAVGGGDIGAAAMPLFSLFARRSVASNPAPKPILIKYGKKPKAKAAPRTRLGLKEAFSEMNGDPTSSNAIDPEFDSSEVTAKLKSLEQRDKEDYRDTTSFGLEDDDGNVIRVRVKSDQASDFEKALNSAMTDADGEEELPEIAELLFKLKDQFDIVDVEWPEVEEDEETDQTINDGGEEGSDMGDQGMDDADLTGDDIAPPADNSAADVLTQVIDMMKADAEARQAEARAREAEAKNREAEAAISQANARVKQEEQLLDMDTFNKNKREQDREAKRLAQLAQWKQEVGADNDSEDDFGLGQSIRGEENEEIRRPASIKSQPGRKTLGGRVHPHDVAKFILNRMR